jgi:DNA-binding response OmpR family regulator
MYLEDAEFRVQTASNGVEALRSFRRELPSLVVLDLMMPEMDGWEVCRHIRQESSVPVIMLTARDDDIDKIVGLEMGADDYVTKPFNPRELIARIRAVLRRLDASADSASDGEEAEPQISLGNVQLDEKRREVRIDDELVQLRSKEFDLLHFLLRNPGLALSREQLLDKVWGYDFYGDTRTVDAHVASLRKRLKKATVQIETVWGIGYKLVE